MAVAFLNANTMTRATASPATASFSVTNSGSNRCAFACVAYDNNSNLVVTAVTYGGVTMTSCGAAVFEATKAQFAQVFYLVNPPTGSNTLSVTLTGTLNEIYLGLSAFTGVDQTTPVRSGTYQTTTGTCSMTITSDANDVTLSCANGGASGFTGGTTNQTLDGVSNVGSYAGAYDHGTTPAATVTHTYSGPTVGAMLGFSIQAVTAGQDTPELYGCPYGQHGQSQMQQLLAG